MSEARPAIIIHGGAWALPDQLSVGSLAGVEAAARRGYQVLEAGGTAVDAVEAAVIVMEDNPAFDAGTGSVLNADGNIEMDAVIMDGQSLKLGAIAGVQNIANPVCLARKVMEETDHTMIVSEGANRFAKEKGIPSVPMEQLVTEEAQMEFERYKKFQTAVDVSFRFQSTQPGCDTVGAAALDGAGNLAFATSTGGITAKRPGRVGDSPLVGCGGYANNETGAVTTTGHGESITKVCLASRSLDLLQHGLNAQKSCESSLDYMAKRVKGTGGLVMVSKAGEFGMHFTTERMPWASLRDGVLKSGIDPGVTKEVSI